MTDIKPETVRLVSRKTGEEREFVLRPFRCGDEEAVLQCVKEEYGDTYYRREYYDRDLLLEQTESGKLHLFMAYCGDDVCGIQSLISYAPKEPRIEAASQIFRKEYRGYGLPYELVKYTYAMAKSLHPSCIYASMVIFHDITQKMCEDAGMKPVAFNFGSHITSKMHNSFRLGTSEKYGQAIMVLPVDKKDAGCVYIHPDIKDPVSRIYDDLGVSYVIEDHAPSDKDDNPKSELSVAINEREQSISITVHAIGADLGEKIRQVKSSHSGQLWTIQLILPTDSARAISAYEELADEGFFFVGVRPLCANVEQIFMQYIGDVHLCFDDFVLTDGFKKLLEDVRKYGKQ